MSRPFKIMTVGLLAVIFAIIGLRFTFPVEAQNVEAVLGLAQTFTEINTFLAGLVTKSVNNIVYVDGVVYPRTGTGIAAAVASLGANGGIVMVPPGTYNVRSTLSIMTPVKIIGSGQNGPSFAGPSPTPSTVFNCGTIAGPCIQFSAVSGSRNAPLKGAGLENVSIQCNGNSQIGLQLLSVRYGRFSDLYVQDCIAENIDLGVVASLADARDTQNNTFDNIVSNTGSTSATRNAHSFRLNGDSRANTSGNVFLNMTMTHQDGNGIYELFGDDNYWSNISVTRGKGGTGIDVYLHGNGIAVQSPQNEVFDRLTPSAGGYRQDGSSNANVIFGYSTNVGAPQPTITTGSLIYTEMGGNSGDNFLRLIRGSGSTASLFNTDSSASGLAECWTTSDIGVPKYQICKDASNNFVITDLVNDVNIFTAQSAGPTLLGAPSGQSVNSSTSLQAVSMLANQGEACTNGELTLSSGWGNAAAVSAVAGTGQTCEWTITSSGTGTAANPTIMDTLTNPLPSANTVCEMRMVGGTGMATLINQTTLSATMPVFTFGGTPAGVSTTYIVVRRCGP